MLAVVGARTKYDLRNQRIHEEAIMRSMIQKILFDGIITTKHHGFKHLEKMDSWWVVDAQDNLLW